MSTAEARNTRGTYQCLAHCFVELRRRRNVKSPENRRSLFFEHKLIPCDAEAECRGEEASERLAEHGDPKK